MENLIGRRLAERYFVKGTLGRGGMAQVYLVWDQKRSVEMAIKVLDQAMLRNEEAWARFLGEAETLSILQHPNIVRFYSLERDGEVTFIVMDYIKGRTLREVLEQSGILSGQQISDIMRDLCGALRYAHQSGYIHCDIKPANIMLNQNGAAMLMDFGIAQLSGTGWQGTAGTAGNMAPEQILGERPTPATDIYALGVLLFEMCTGSKPFTGKLAIEGQSRAEAIRREQLYAPTPLARAVNANVSVEMEGLIAGCMEKTPAQRIPNTQRLLHDLEAAVLGWKSEAAVKTSEMGGKQEDRFFVKRKLHQKTRMVTAATVGGLLIAVAGLAAVLTGSGSSPAASATADQAALIFQIVPFDKSLAGAGECITCPIQNWVAPSAPGNYAWEVTFKTGIPIEISNDWCAKDMQKLDQNWGKIQFMTVLSGEEIDFNEMAMEIMMPAQGWVCRAQRGLILNLSKGEHVYEKTMVLEEDVYDGEQVFAAGIYHETYRIRIE